MAARYGETEASPYLLPFSVDGLIVVASISLVELAGRIRIAEEQPTVHIRGTVPDRPANTVPDQSTVPDGQSTQDDRRNESRELLPAARNAAEDHRREHGKDITRDALRERLRVSNAAAGELLRQLRTTAPAALPPVPPNGLTRTNRNAVHSGVAR